MPFLPYLFSSREFGDNLIGNFHFGRFAKRERRRRSPTSDYVSCSHFPGIGKSENGATIRKWKKRRSFSSGAGIKEAKSLCRLLNHNTLLPFFPLLLFHISLPTFVTESSSFSTKFPFPSFFPLSSSANHQREKKEGRGKEGEAFKDNGDKSSLWRRRRGERRDPDTKEERRRRRHNTILGEEEEDAIKKGGVCLCVLFLLLLWNWNQRQANFTHFYSLAAKFDSRASSFFHCICINHNCHSLPLPLSSTPHTS